jgi:hypothetical protein
LNRECGAFTRLPPPLAVLAVSHLRQLTAEDPSELVVECDLQCFLEEHEDGEHHGLVTDTAGEGPDLWATWSEDAPAATLVHLTACTRENGKDGGLQECCTLFTRHPGRCTFDLTAAAVTA